MDGITLLKDDHRTVEQLFKRFEKAGDRAHVEKRRIVDRIIEELAVHAAIEEQLFYPVARAAVRGTEDMALESLEEHHVIKWSLSELADMEPDHERFDAKVTVLIENVRHHVDEEESDFFPKVRDQLTRTELTDLGDALAKAKKSAPTHPHPRMPDAGPVTAVAGAITGVVDRVGDNISGIAQGSVTAIQDLIAGFLGSDRPEVSPTGTSTARTRARDVRSAASTATDGVTKTARSAKSGATSTAKAAKAGAKSTATVAKKSTRTTAKAAKRAATPTGRSAAKKSTSKAKKAASAPKKKSKTKKKSTAKKSKAAAKRSPSKKSAAASRSR